MPTIKVYIDPRHEAVWYGKAQQPAGREVVPAPGTDTQQQEQQHP